MAQRAHFGQGGIRTTFFFASTQPPAIESYRLFSISPTDLGTASGLALAPVPEPGSIALSRYRAFTQADQAWAAVVVDSLTALVVVLDDEGAPGPDAASCAVRQEGGRNDS